MNADLQSHYRELPPPPALADRLVCLWTQRITGSGTYRHPVLPDGCVDFVWIGDAAPVVAGPATRRLVVDLPSGTEVIGARLRPGWAGASLGVSMDDMLNRDVLLSDLWGDNAADRCAEQVLAAASIPARLHELGSVLTRHFASGRIIDPGLGAAVAWLARHPSGRIQDLARWTGLGERQLHRRLRSALGYGPKTFQRIMRLQRLLTLVSRPAAGLPRQSLPALACDAGYADQAHMCREVHALTGETPKSLLSGGFASAVAMSDLFNTDDGGHA